MERLSRQGEQAETVKKSVANELGSIALEQAKSEPEWKAYVNTLTDKQIENGDFDPNKLTQTAEDFHVDPDTYPIFNRQTVLGEKWGDRTKTRWNIDKILTEYLGFTANLIGKMDGHNEKIPKTDHVIYLDKSARPVSWLVDEFWDDFAIKDSDGQSVPPPEKSYLNIDRVPWFRRVGLDVNDNLEFIDSSAKRRKGTFHDFSEEVKAGKLKREDVAAIRALYLPGGRTTDDIDEIMRTPSTLDGKNIMIVDEVSDTGSTPQIAQLLLEKAFPEAKSINIHVYADFDKQYNEDGTEHQMRGAPVWYPDNHSYIYGRGVLDFNRRYWEELYAKEPTPENYAKLKAEFVLSEPMNLNAEPGGESLELQREIRQYHQDFQDGKVLFSPVHARDWDQGDRGYISIVRQGINPQNFQSIRQAIDAREADPYYSLQFPPH